MLEAWYGHDMWVHQTLSYMVGLGRVWRCADGLYTSITRYSHEQARRPVTDQMLERYGFNL